MTFCLVRTPCQHHCMHCCLCQPSKQIQSKPSDRCCAGASLMSPIIKSLLTEREPAALKYRGRAAVMHRVEQRMRFLAVRACSGSVCYHHANQAAATCWSILQADSAATLRGQYPSYRELLLRICQKLGIRCPSTLLTEVQSFENVAQRCTMHACKYPDQL